MQPGSIVRFRGREWVLLPSDDKNIYLLRPLTGVVDDVVAVHRDLSTIIAYTLPEERIRSSRFPPPSFDDLSDTASADLLWQAARLALWEGATPLRSLGRMSIRPRVYQFVPLLMALRLDPVRLFIADDVGVEEERIRPTKFEPTRPNTYLGRVTFIARRQSSAAQEDASGRSQRRE